MPRYRVMFVMPVSTVVEVDIDADDVVDPIEIADLASQELPGFTDHNWDATDPEPFDAKGEPYMIELVEEG